MSDSHPISGTDADWPVSLMWKVNVGCSNTLVVGALPVGVTTVLSLPFEA